MISWRGKEIQVTKEDLGLDATLIKERTPSHMEDNMRRKGMIQDAINLAFGEEGMGCKGGPSEK